MIFNHLIMCRCILIFYLLLQIILTFNVLPFESSIFAAKC